MPHESSNCTRSVVQFVVHLILTSHITDADTLLITIIALFLDLSINQIRRLLESTKSELKVTGGAKLPWKRLAYLIDNIVDLEATNKLHIIKTAVMEINNFISWKAFVEQTFHEYLNSHASQMQLEGQLQGLQTMEVPFTSLNDLGLEKIILLSELKSVPHPPKHFLVPMIEPSLDHTK